MLLEDCYRFLVHACVDITYLRRDTIKQAVKLTYSLPGRKSITIEVGYHPSGEVKNVVTALIVATSQLKRQLAKLNIKEELKNETN